MFTKDAFSTPLAPYQTMRTAPATMNPPDMAAFAELLAKVEELLKRPAERWETVLSVGPLHLDLLTRSVRRGERSIELRPREFRLLEYMMRHKEQVLNSSHAVPRSLELQICPGVQSRGRSHGAPAPQNRSR